MKLILLLSAIVLTACSTEERNRPAPASAGKAAFGPEPPAEYVDQSKTGMGTKTIEGINSGLRVVFIAGLTPVVLALATVASVMGPELP